MIKNLHITIILFFLLLTGCTSQRDESVNPEKANEVTFTAMQQVGKPYRYGGSSPKTGFDCSGLVDYVYRESVGIKLPRTVKALKEIAVPTVDKDDLETGDLVIFATGRSNKPDHAGIYVGKGRFVHAPSTGGKVRLDQIEDEYWERSFLIGKRPLANR
ncbi:MAG TPA: C40 family peptidase [Pseudomonadales bacterium]|nr:C40 family peptidase [Pseudomonadales bacterium]